ncbi:cytochrome p450 domain-containing protein [Phthorimaea operculella]|nr:cytochrome p450 domain-containing protein [Phthorimaea operculella]
MFLSILVLGVVVLVLVCCYLRWSRWARLVAKIPGPPELPLLGHAWTLRNVTRESLFVQLRQWAKEFKRIYTIKMGAFRVSVNIFHPDDVEAIYSTTAHNEKQLPYNFLRPWLCEGLLISNGEKWKQRRKLLTPAFHFNILKRFCISFNDQTEMLLKSVEAETDKDKTDIWPLITKTTLSIMCETSMGISVQKAEETITKRYFKSLHSIGDLLVKRYITAAYHLDWIYNLFNSKKQSKLIKNLHNFTEKIIHDRKSFRDNNEIANFDKESEEGKEKARLAMLDLLLENERDNKIDIKGIREEVDTFLFEGHDTTAAALSFMIMRIANETHVQEKVYEELLRVFGESTRLPTTGDLNELKYLECCIKESMRLYPSVFFMARIVGQDVMLGDYLVPGGVVVHVHVYDLHHDPAIYPDPEKFDPDRFLPEQVVKRHPYAYIPFSAGPRNCIGQKFAMLEMKTVMSGLLRRFRLEPVTRSDQVVLVSDLVLRAKHPMYVKFRPRRKLVL